MEIPQEFIFNQNYKTSTLLEMFEQIGLYIQDLEKRVQDLDSDEGDLIDDLSDEADKIEQELEYRGAINTSKVIEDFKHIYTQKVSTKDLDLNVQNIRAGL